MTALIIIGAIILFLAFILSLKGKLTVAYSDELSLTLKVLFVKIKILPKKDRRKKVRPMSKRAAQKIERKLAKKKANQEEKKLHKKQQKDAEKKEGKKKSLSDILDVIELVTKIARAALGAFWGHLKIDVTRFKIKVATDNAAATAIAYGAVSGAANCLFEFLENEKKVKGLNRADTDISCDFLADTPEADIDISFSLRVWHILHIGIASLISVIKHKISADNKKSNQ